MAFNFQSQVKKAIYKQRNHREWVWNLILILKNKTKQRLSHNSVKHKDKI